MKFSLKLPENQDHKTPIVKGKLPITMFNQPFTSSFTSAINSSSSDLSFSLSTNFPSGPCLKLSYSPMAASPSAASTTDPFTLSLKSGLGLFGSPEDSPLVFSSQFSLSLSKPFVPTFSLLFKPQFGHFCLKKSTVSRVNDRFPVFQPNDGVQLDSGSDSNPKFGSGFAVDESMGWQELKLESSSGHGSQEEFGAHSDGGIYRHLAETKTIRDSVFKGVAVMARTAIPVTKRVAVNFRWGMNFPTNPVMKMPFLTVNKISVERVEEEKEEKKKTGEGQGGDVELLKGMLFWMKNDVETLEKENREMKQLLEEIKLGSVANKAAPSSGLSYGDFEPWRNNRSGWEESKSKNNRNGGQENDWRKKKSNEEENGGQNNRRGGEKNGAKVHSSTNRANEVESELERAIKAASQVKA